MAEHINLSGGQIQEILDHLIYSALDPVIRYSNIFDSQVIYLLTLTTRNKKRKVSALGREEFISSLCYFLITKSAEEKLEIIAKCKLERNFVLGFLTNFLRSVETYQDLYIQWLNTKDKFNKKILGLKLKAIETNYSFNSDRLYSSITHVADFLKLAYDFRNTIVSNYIKSTYTHANIFCKVKGENFDVNDVYQNFLTILTKAIDKYDSSKGALTSYINWWILNAQTNGNKDFGHEYNIAYIVPQNQKKSLVTNKSEVNFSISLDKVVGDDDEQEVKDFVRGDPGLDESLEIEQKCNFIRYIAKCSDIRGMARLYLDIDESFSPKELHQMKQLMVDQGIVSSIEEI